MGSTGRGRSGERLPPNFRPGVPRSFVPSRVAVAARWPGSGETRRGGRVLPWGAQALTSGQGRSPVEIVRRQAAHEMRRAGACLILPTRAQVVTRAGVGPEGSGNGNRRLPGSAHRRRERGPMPLEAMEGRGY
jgi:hypothetical protein